jgi:mannose-6-phosphate isomerase-like protein (cupin superfamily)
MPFIDTKAIEIKEPRPGWKGRFFSSASMTFGHYEIEAGAWIHAHDHPNEEVWHVLEGELEVTIAGETHIAGPGGVAVVPPNTTHSVKALSAGRAPRIDRRYQDGLSPLRSRASPLPLQARSRCERAQPAAATCSTDLSAGNTSAA